MNMCMPIRMGPIRMSMTRSIKHKWPIFRWAVFSADSWLRRTFSTPRHKSLCGLAHRRNILIYEPSAERYQCMTKTNCEKIEGKDKRNFKDRKPYRLDFEFTPLRDK